MEGKFYGHESVHSESMSFGSRNDSSTTADGSKYGSTSARCCN